MGATVNLGTRMFAGGPGWFPIWRWFKAGGGGAIPAKGTGRKRAKVEKASDLQRPLFVLTPD